MSRPLDDARAGGPLGRREVAESVGVSLETARRFWQALGFAQVSDDTRIFTDADRLALERIVGLMRSGAVDEEAALSLTRAYARAADQLASWQGQVLREMEDRRGAPGASAGAGAARGDVGAGAGWAGGTGGAGGPGQGGGAGGAGGATAAAALLSGLVDDFEDLLVYAWRRHLAAAIEQLEAVGDEARPRDGERPGHGGSHLPVGADGETPAPLVGAAEAAGGSPREKPGHLRAVGFADMVGFTRLAQQLDDHSLGVLVERFEAGAADIIAAHGGRLVKTIGDEVMFSARDVLTAARIAGELQHGRARHPDGGDLPELRIGLAWGPVVPRLGDLYGTTVNTAARLTTTARPGTILVDERAAALLADAPGLTVSPLRRRTMPGLGTVQAYALRGSVARRPA